MDGISDHDGKSCPNRAIDFRGGRQATRGVVRAVLNLSQQGGGRVSHLSQASPLLLSTAMLRETGR